MNARQDQFRIAIGASTPDTITVLGRDFTNEILGRLSFGDMAFLELTGRIRTGAESRMSGRPRRAMRHGASVNDGP
jgi:hypothetical protein